MKYCKAIGCNSSFSSEDSQDYCPKCRNVAAANDSSTSRLKQDSSGSDNNYWLIDIPNPKRLDPYTVECEDLIEALEMSFQEGEAFKAIYRKCKLRLGDGKPGDTEIRNAEKVRHYGERMEIMEKRKRLS